MLVAFFRFRYRSVCNSYVESLTLVSSHTSKPVESRSGARETMLAWPYHKLNISFPIYRRPDRRKHGYWGRVSPHHPTISLKERVVSFPTGVWAEPRPNMDFMDI